MSENPYILALEYMQQHGWTRNEARNELGQVCLLGAMAFGIPRNTGLVSAAIAMCLDLRQVCKEQYGTDIVAHVNDRDDMNQAEAEAILEKAAVRWEERI